MIYDPDQGRAEEYAEIEFKTQADANAAVTHLNAIFRTATRITFKQQGSNLGV
jgi:RNA recognition motif-containing protein